MKTNECYQNNIELFRMSSRLRAHIDAKCRVKSPKKQYCLFKDSFLSIIIDSSSEKLGVFLSIQSTIIEEDQQVDLCVLDSMTKSKINLATQRRFSDGSCFDDHFGAEKKLAMVHQGTNSKYNF